MNNEYIDPVLAEINKLTLENNQLLEVNLFKIQEANKWIEEASTRPIPKMLFSEFWYEGEICILFADTNQGKSILATQIADSITKGINISGFKNDAEKQAVLYFDFELSDKQFQMRYTNELGETYNFSNNFYRAEINPYNGLPEGFKNFESYLIHSIEQSVIEIGVKIIIIDNITYLSDETEKAQKALPLMKELSRLKKEHGLSILVLAHTPKRDFSKPISRNDLQGSKMLINFTDSAFAIGESMKDMNIKYIKQIKTRNSEYIYDSENVIVCQLQKNNNFLGFKFIGFSSESEHLKSKSEQEKKEFENAIIQLYKNGYSYGKIAEQLNTNKMKVKRTIDKYLKESNGLS